MKKTILLSLASLPLFFSACEHESITTGLDFNITLDSSNTYYAGQPVRFNIEGDVDNIIFYSGEFGSEYQYRDRYSLSEEYVESAICDLEIRHRYGTAGTWLEVYITNSFDGLSGTDGEADRAAVAAMYEAGMQGWTKVPYQDDSQPNANTNITDIEVDLTDYLDNFCMAVHWMPTRRESDGMQDTYFVNGDFSINFDGFDPTTFDLASIIDVTVMMDESLDPYYKNDGNGSIRLNTAQDINFAGGVGTNFGSGSDHDCEGWVFTAPISLNKISNDQAIVIKNIQNALPYYEYTWTEPGTYEVVFVGSTADYLNSGSEVRAFTINILDTPIGE